MIHSLTGTIKEISETGVVLDTGAFGFGISTAQPHKFQVGQQAHMLTYMHWNAENGPSLFGFATALEKTVFLLIIDCPGVGPKIGMAVLGHMSPAEFLEAVQSANEKALSSVNGIGAKKAEQIIVQLKHKVAKLVDAGIDLGDSAMLEQRHEIGQVLKTLNYSKAEISSAMHYLNESYPGNVAFDQLMRHALAYLSKRPQV